MIFTAHNQKSVQVVMEGTVFLGAPDAKRLEETWKAEYLDNEILPLSQQLGRGTAWRRLWIPGLELDHAGTDSSGARTLDRDALDTSFALYNGDLVSRPADEEAQNMSLDSVPATQFPAFDFDMGSVLDVEDIFEVPLVDKNGRQIAYSMLAAILDMSEARQVVTRRGDRTQVVILSLGDATANGFEMALWGSHAHFATEHLRRLDIVLFQDFVLSQFKGALGGTSRQGRSSFTILYRVARRDGADDRYRPVLQRDLQSARVRALREWVTTWMPSETQPIDSQERLRPDDDG